MHARDQRYTIYQLILDVIPVAMSLSPALSLLLDGLARRRQSCASCQHRQHEAGVFFDGAGIDQVTISMITNNRAELENFRLLACSFDRAALHFAVDVAVDATTGGMCSAERISPCILSALRELSGIYELLLDAELLVQPRYQWHALLLQSLATPAAAQFVPLVPATNLLEWQLLRSDAHASYLFRTVPALHDAAASRKSLVSALPWWGWAAVAGATAAVTTAAALALSRPKAAQPLRYYPASFPPLEGLVAALTNPDIGLPLPLMPLPEAVYAEQLKRAAAAGLRAAAAPAAVGATAGVAAAAATGAFDRASSSAARSAATAVTVTGAVAAAAAAAGTALVEASAGPLRSVFAATVDTALAAMPHLEASESEGVAAGALAADEASGPVAKGDSSAVAGAMVGGEGATLGAGAGSIIHASSAPLASSEAEVSHGTSAAAASLTSPARPTLDIEGRAAAMLPHLRSLKLHLHSVCASAAAYAGFIKHVVAGVRDRLAEVEAAMAATVSSSPISNSRSGSAEAEEAGAEAAAAAAASQLQATCDDILDHVDRALKRTGFAPEPPSRVAAIAAVDAAAASASSAASAASASVALSARIDSCLASSADALPPGARAATDDLFARLMHILRASEAIATDSAPATAAASSEYTPSRICAQARHEISNGGTSSRLETPESTTCSPAVALMATGAVPASASSRARARAAAPMSRVPSPLAALALARTRPGSAGASRPHGSSNLSAVALARAREFEANRWLRWSMSTDALQVALDSGKLPAWLLWERRCSVCWLPFAPRSLIVAAYAPALVAPDAAGAAGSNHHDYDGSDDDGMLRHDDHDDDTAIVWDPDRQRRLRERHERRAAAAAAAAPVMSNQGPLVALVPCSRQHPVCLPCASKHLTASRSTALGPWAMPDGSRPPPPEAPLQAHRSPIAIVGDGLAAAGSWLAQLPFQLALPGRSSTASSTSVEAQSDSRPAAPSGPGPRVQSASCRSAVDGCGMHCPVCRQPVVARLVRLESPFVAASSTAVGTSGLAGASRNAAEVGAATHAEPRQPAQ